MSRLSSWFAAMTAVTGGARRARLPGLGPAGLVSLALHQQQRYTVHSIASARAAADCCGRKPEYAIVN